MYSVNISNKTSQNSIFTSWSILDLNKNGEKEADLAKIQQVKETERIKYSTSLVSSHMETEEREGGVTLNQGLLTSNCQGFTWALLDEIDLEIN